MEQYSKPKIKKVADGSCTQQKKSTASKVFSFLINKDIDNIPKYFIDEVGKPIAYGMVSLIIDNVTDGIKGLIGGDKYYSNGSRVFTNYSKSAKTAPRRISEPRERPAKIGYAFDNVQVPTRAQAERVLLELEKWLIDYKMIRVADLYEAAGLTPDPTMNDYGWLSIRDFHVVPYDGAWVIETPTAELLVK